MKKNKKIKPQYVCKLSIWKIMNFWQAIWNILLVAIFAGATVLALRPELNPLAEALSPMAWSIIFAVVMIATIISPIIMLGKIILLKSYRLSFYEDTIMTEWGIFNRHKRKTAYTGVVSIAVNRPFWGYFGNFGHIRIDMVGKWDLREDYVARPRRLQKYLEKRILKAKEIRRAIVD